MPTLFEATTINGMHLRNRLVRSATWEGMCESDGRPTDKLINYYRNLTRGGVGLIITGYAFVRPEGKQLPGQMGIHDDTFRDEYIRMTRTVHEAGGKIAAQLVHCGGQTDHANAGRRPLAPSAVKVDQFAETPEELSPQEIQAIVNSFAAAARRAKDWGFDAVQLHGAHGYLINQFLSPLTNRRTDDYGGNLEHRCRFLLEVYHAVREAVGEHFPVLLKLNGSDNLKGGLTVEDAVHAARLIAAGGIDAIEISGGTPASGKQSPVRMDIDSPEKEAYNLDLARRVKMTVGCPVMAVGGIRSYDVAQIVLARNEVDYISMARPLIREPNLPKRWQQGDHTPATCISCNGCFRPGLREGGIYCVIDKEERKKG